MSTNLVVVAIPDENDRVWRISSEKIPHMTLLFLGDPDKVDNLDSIMQFVEHAADRSLNRFYLPVDRRGELGADKADVLFFKKGRYDFKAVRDFRHLLLQNQNIKTAHDSTSQFEFPDHVGAAGQEWIPHLTLGYPDTPAKSIPDDQMTQIYDVQFNKIAVWPGDFDGPEFQLKDYWDEMDNIDMQDSPALAMASANEARKSMGLDAAIEHFGVRGMRWGVRNDTTVTVNGKTKQVSAKKAEKLDTKFEKKATSVDTFIKLHNAAADGVNKEIPAFNASFEKKYGKETMDSGILWNDNHPITREYHAAYNAMNLKHLNAAAEKMGTNPTGTKKIVIRSENNDSLTEFGWGAATEKVKHAASDSDPETIVYIAQQDEQGRIISVKLQEDSMAQTEELGVEFLEHYGVKGMRWGVRNDGSGGGVKEAAKSVGSGAKKAAQGVGRAAVATAKFAGDVSFENRVEDGRAREAVISSAGKEFRKTDLPAIKAKPEHQKAAKLKNRLLNPRDPGTRAYRKEVRETYIQRLETTANSMTNASGTRQYTIRERGVDLPAQGGALPQSKYFWDVSARNVKHTADEVLALDYTRLEVEMDGDGWITGVKLATEDESLAQTTDLGVAFLSHYGVKGMRWGVRSEAPTAVATTAKSVVPHGDKRKTKIQVEGGQNHPASTDAIRVAQAHEKLKKSGVKALSNQELQDVQNRLNLERNVKQLTGATTTVGRGRAFVKGLTGFGKDINEPLNTGLQTARLVKQLS